MRIAIDVVLAEYEPGGMLLATRALLMGLTRVSQEHDYVIITGQPEAYQELAEARNIRIYPLKLPSQRATLVQHQLLAPLALKQIRPDVLHVAAFAAPLNWQGALVTTVHDLAFMKVPEQASLYARLYHEHLQRMGAQRAQRVIAISEQTREELLYYWSIPNERIRLIHHALRPSLYSGEIAPAQITEMRRRYGESYLLHAGRIMPRKNVERLLEAFELIGHEFPQLHLVLTGGLGYASEQAVHLIETSAHKDRIHQAGWVPEEEMAALYAAATALVFPSKHEGQGMPTLEAMACGTAVVASPEAASQEIAGDAVIRADCSSPQPLADAIKTLLTDEALRARLIEQGKQQAQQFHYEICARETARAYEEAWESYRHQTRRIALPV